MLRFARATVENNSFLCKNNTLETSIFMPFSKYYAKAAA